jgi:hypothetical protein
MMMGSAQLEKALDSIATMDCHNILNDHLERVRVVAGDLSPDVPGEVTESMLLRLQLSLNSYFHFLSRLDPEQQILQTKLTTTKSKFASISEVMDGLKRIEGEFREAIKQLIQHISALEGSNLLSWVHQIRYYLTRAITKLDDLSDWAASLAYVSSYCENVKDSAKFLDNGWPEFASQSLSLLESLESECSKHWSFGSGRKTKLLCMQLERALRGQRILTKTLLEIQAETLSLIQALSPTADERVKTLIEEYDKLRESPTARLEYLADEAAETFRHSSVKNLIDDIDASFEKRLSCIRDWTGAHDWLEMLRDGHDGLIPLNEVSQHNLPIFEVTAPLIKSLKNAEQRDELASRRESLIRTLVEAELTLNDHTTSSSEYVDWLVKRLTPRPKRGEKLCARFSESFLPDDKAVQCSRCHSYCHPECLIDGTCPVDGNVILSE